MSKFKNSNTLPFQLKLGLSIGLIGGLILWLTSCDSGESKLMMRSGGGAVDIDGNEYQTVVIGDQEWFAENLRTTRNNDGTNIDWVNDLDVWFSKNNASYCNYNNSAEYSVTYGPLYNWYVVESGKACPTDWHVPSSNEWEKLIANLGGVNKAGGKLKEDGFEHWLEPNEGATNESLFRALPGGYTYPTPNSYGNAYQNGFWWSATEVSSTKAYSVMMSYQNSNAKLNSDYSKKQGLSIRCIKSK